MDKFVLRFIKVCMVASIALFFTLVAFGNITDYESNWQFVQHVLSMDDTFHSPELMWRAVINPIGQALAYKLIIAWQVVTAIMCWFGCFALFAKIKKTPAQFNNAKSLAFIGLFMGFLLYMVGFVIIGGEWFSMWQSTKYNAQMIAGLFVSLILFVMLFLQGADN